MCGCREFSGCLLVLSSIPNVAGSMGSLLSVVDPGVNGADAVRARLSIVNVLFMG